MAVFKAPLIVDQAFYKSRQFMQIMSLLMAVPVGVISNFYEFDVYILIPLLLLFSILFYYQIKMLKKFEAYKASAKVHMDESSIKTFGQDGNIKEELVLDSEYHVIVKERYSLPEQDFRASLNEMAGDHHKSYLIIDKAGEKRKFEFLFESHYMQVQLKKVIQSWRERGVNITAVD